MKSPVLGLAFSAVAFGASTVYLWVQLDAAQTQAEALNKANAEMATRIVELQKRREDLAQQQQQQQMAAMADPGARWSRAYPPNRNADAAPSPPDQKAAWTHREMRNPPPMPEGMVKMMRANMRAQNKRLYFDLQSKLGLTDAQASDLLDLITEERAAGFKGPRNQDPEAAREYWEAEQARRQVAIEDLLGPAKAAEFAEYQKSMPARGELLMISQQLEGVDTPLNDNQRSRLLDALIAERDRIPMPTYVEGTPQEDLVKQNNDWQDDYEKRVAEAARGILTSEQLNTLSEYQQWQREIRQQFAAQGPEGGPPARMMRGGNAMFMPGPAGGVAITVAADPASSSPTEKPAGSK